MGVDVDENLFAVSVGVRMCGCGWVGVCERERQT